MRRPVVVLLATLVLGSTMEPAARAHAQAAGPFPEVPVRQSSHRSHFWGYAAMTCGAGLVGASFLLQRQADRRYEEYLVATDPATIEDLYDRTVLADRLSSGALIGGELLIATGLYLRFLRPPPESSLSLSVAPDRCAVSLRF